MVVVSAWRGLDCRARGVAKGKMRQCHPGAGPGRNRHTVCAPMLDIPSRDLAVHLARTLDDKSGEDIVVLALPTGQLVDLVVVATGRSDRQTHALAEECRRFGKDLGLSSRGVEGQSGWMVVDCYDVVVHVLTQEMRDFYRLERIWPEAESVDWRTAMETLPRILDPNRPKNSPEPSPENSPADATD